MSYTPSMDELREAWLQAEFEERDASTSDDDLRAEFDRALAAHDAEVRASVVTEEPEWSTERQRHWCNPSCSDGCERWDEVYERKVTAWLQVERGGET